MNLILLGAPGAGKGTLASYLIEKMGVPSISTGNILREAIKNNTPLGQSAKEYMDAGKLVPDQLVIDLLKERIAKRDCKSGFILDGFPRTIPQAEALDEIAKIDCALALEVPNEVIEKRMTGRRVCLRCGATYHVEANPPRVKDVCDICGDKLVIRSEKIRTYNFPQDRCTDHRIGLTVHNLSKIMDGNLDELIDALATREQAEKLQKLNEQG